MSSLAYGLSQPIYLLLDCFSRLFCPDALFVLFSLSLNLFCSAVAPILFVLLALFVISLCQEPFRTLVALAALTHPSDPLFFKTNKTLGLYDRYEVEYYICLTCLNGPTPPKQI